MRASPRAGSLPDVAALHDAGARRELVRQLRRALDDVASGRLPRELAFAPAAGRWRRMGHYTRAGELVKRVADRVLAALALVLASPLLGLLALAVRVDSRGPVLLRQVRIGRGGRPFTLLKLRALRVDARRPAPGAGAPDPRLTRVGRFLRRSRLDELPSLANVVRGELSLVGPRPRVPARLAQEGACAKLVLSVRPGLTSLAALVAGEPAGPREALELDLRYVRERSLRLDLGVLLAGAWRAVSGRRLAA